MNTYTFRSGLRLKLLLASAAGILILIGALMIAFGNTRSGLPSPIFLSVAFIFVLLRFGNKPLFIISENEIKIYNHHKPIPVNQIEEIKIVSTDKYELILKDALPVPLILWMLSPQDRNDLKTAIEKLIGHA